MASEGCGMKASNLGVALLMLVLGGCTSTVPHREVRAVLALQQQAEAAYARGDMAQALSVYRVLIDQVPDDETVWFRLGNIYARIDQPQDAVASYQQALQRDASHAKAWHNLGVVLLQQAQEAFSRSEQLARGDTILRERSRTAAHAIGRISHSNGAPAAVTDHTVEDLDTNGAIP